MKCKKGKVIAGTDEVCVDLLELLEWSRNIAGNYNSERDTNLYGQLMNAGRDMELDVDNIDIRWQDFEPGEIVTVSDVEELLIGSAPHRHMYGRRYV